MPRIPACAAALTLILAACGGQAASLAAGQSGAAAVPSTLDELIQAAKKEGEVSWAVAPNFADGITPTKDLIAKKYGVTLNITFSGQLNYSEKAAKAVSEVQAGAPATYDILDVSDSTLPPLTLNNAAFTVPWKKYLSNLPDEALVNSTLIVTYNAYLGPAYNSKLIPASEAPKGYADLLDAKWKGKVSVINTMSNWVWLAQPNAWGEQKLLDYMKKLAQQNPVQDRYDGMLSRLVSGEYPISSGIDQDIVNAAKQKGQPVESITSDVNRSGRYGEVVTANAKHPSAATLIALALVTPEGQEIKDKVQTASASWIPGTRSYKFAQEHTTIPQDVDFLEKNSARIVKELDQIMRSGGAG
jgi:iron(III) transport system substrate-binding protein